MLPLFAGDIMKITFIYHSSFAVELENCVLVFDYYGEGQLPTIPENKKIYFLNSHAHPDHFKREILEQMVGALNEGVAYNKKNISMEMKALCQIRK